MNEEYIYKLNMFQQEAQKIEEQINLVGQQVIELRNLQANLEEIDKDKQTEILAPIGRGIYLKSEIKDKKMFVNIGSNIVLRKNCKETQEIIEKQIIQLNEIKERFMEDLGSINTEVTKVIELAQGNQHSEHECKCKKGEKCEHEDGECECGEEGMCGHRH